MLKRAFAVVLVLAVGSAQPLFALSGWQLSPPFPINTTAVDPAALVGASADPDGNIAVVYRTVAAGTSQIRARFFGPQGSPLGPELVLLATTGQLEARVAPRFEDLLVLTYVETPTATGESTVSAACFNLAGQLADGPFLISSAAAFEQHVGRIGESPVPGFFLATWSWPSDFFQGLSRYFSCAGGVQMQHLLTTSAESRGPEQVILGPDEHYLFGTDTFEPLPPGGLQPHYEVGYLPSLPGEADIFLLLREVTSGGVEYELTPEPGAYARLFRDAAGPDHSLSWQAISVDGVLGAASSLPGLPADGCSYHDLNVQTLEPDTYAVVTTCSTSHLAVRMLDTAGTPASDVFEIGESSPPDTHAAGTLALPGGDLLVLFREGEGELFGQLVRRELFFYDGFESGDLSAWAP